MAEIDSRDASWEDHLAAAIKAFRKELSGWQPNVVPEEFQVHQRAAKREMLLAWRSLLDARIAKLETEDKEQAAPKAARIKVE